MEISRSKMPLVFIVSLLVPAPAMAHGFGQRYDLPVPLGLFMMGAGAAVALSFMGMGLFLRGDGKGTAPHYNLVNLRLLGWLAHPRLLAAVRASSAALFALVMFAGFFGNPNPNANLLPTVVWILWWVGLVYVCALIGNLWALLNPWDVIFNGAEALWERIRPGESLSLERPYPEKLGAWPAVVLFLWFAWAEIVWQGNDIPASLTRVALFYSVITWAGMFVFGRETWLRKGEAFSVFFGIVSQFAITEVRRMGPERSGPNQVWNLRPPGVGLSETGGVTDSMMVLVVLALSTVSFDGFTETGLWHNLRALLYYQLVWIGRDALLVTDTVALLVVPLLFLGVYLFFCLQIRLMSGSDLPVSVFARAFVFSLVPIAIGYHVAHYFSFLLIQGQRIIPLASDPFGFGWNLLGTAGYRIDIAIIGAKTTWYISVAAIVAGHIAAVYLAHVKAFELLPHRFAALRSQYPMLVLMVGYTMVSLWIIAQPIVEG